MKRRLVLFICLALNAGLLTGIQAQSTPVPTPVVSRVIGQDIFVRGGPGRAYMPVGRLVEGDRVKPVSRNTSADWVLIVYRNGFGWIRRDLADWIEDIDALPVIRDDSLTPSPTSIQSVTATPAELFILPTQTPTGNWVQLGPDVASGYVRAGPGRTYLRLGQLLTGDIVEPVGRNADSTWIMIRFGNGFGWIARNLARWVVVVDDLPVVDPVNLTPSQTFTASFTPSSTATLTSTPTYTATATATATPTSTATSTVTLTLTRTPSPTSSSTATFTPSSTSTASFTPTFTLTATPTASLTPSLTATLTPSFTATSTFTATPSATFTSWPIVTNTFAPRLTETSVSAAVSSLTLTPTVSPSPTSVPSSSPAPTDTPTPTPTLTVTPSFTVAPTSTATASPSPTATPATILMAPSATSTRVFTVSAVPTSTAVQTRTPLPTQTSQPTNTPTASVTTTLTRTPLPTPTNQPTNTPTASVTTTLTRTPLPTRTSVPTHTPTTRVTATQRVTLTLTATSTATLTRTATARGTITQVAIGSPTLMLSPTAIRPTVTPQSEIIVLVTEVPTAFASATITSLPQVSPTLIPTTPTMPLRPTPPASAQRDSVLNVPVEAWVGGIVLLGLLAYVGLYLRGQAQLDRYQNGFVVDRCPVCQRGRLIIEDRRERLVGIPRPRRIVRCDDCRSVLRETGSRRWRYAIDPLEDIELYRRYNGQAIDEQTLVELSRRASVPPRVSDQLTESPQFDDET